MSIVHCFIFLLVFAAAMVSAYSFAVATLRAFRKTASPIVSEQSLAFALLSIAFGVIAYAFLIEILRQPFMQMLLASY
jgi:hypothetical protein